MERRTWRAMFAQIEARIQAAIPPEERHPLVKGLRLNLRTRFLVLDRDNFTCRYCGRKAPDVALQVDHVFPKSKGGKNTMDNFVAACVDCNQGKKDIILSRMNREIALEQNVGTPLEQPLPSAFGNPLQTFGFWA